MDSTGDRAAGLWETGKCSLDGGSPFAQGRRGAWQPASEAAGAAADTAVWSARDVDAGLANISRLCAATVLSRRPPALQSAKYRATSLDTPHQPISLFSETHIPSSGLLTLINPSSPPP